MGKEKYKKVAVENVAIKNIIPIEAHSEKKIEKIKNKILSEGWKKPIVLFFNKNKSVYHVLDGHHRHQVGKSLKLKSIPAVVVDDYEAIPIRSLRKSEEVNYDLVIKKSLEGEIYPYKTVKHDFPFIIPSINVNLKDLV